MADSTTTIQQLKDIVTHFIHERDWRQFHGPKNMSIDISIEAAELMELFVWTRTTEDVQAIINNKREAVEHEVADILFALLAFADECNIDISKALQDKMIHNANKYPVERVKGSNKKYNEY